MWFAPANTECIATANGRMYKASNHKGDWSKPKFKNISTDRISSSPKKAFAEAYNVKHPIGANPMDGLFVYVNGSGWTAFRYATLTYIRNRVRAATVISRAWRYYRYDILSPRVQKYCADMARRHGFLNKYHLDEQEISIVKGVIDGRDEERCDIVCRAMMLFHTPHISAPHYSDEVDIACHKYGMQKARRMASFLARKTV